MKLGFNFFAACVVVGVSVSHVWASGFSHDDITAAGAGSANAIVAGADDLSAAFYNPAGLAWQEGVQAMLGSQSRTRNIGASTVSGGEGSVPGLNMFAISWLQEGGDWGVAGSISTPYSVQTNWNNNFVESIGETDLTIARYAVDTFWRANNTLAVSLGIDLYDVTTTLNNNGGSFSGTGWSNPGVHAGLRWEFQPFWMLGLTLRQGASLSVSDASGSSFDMTLPDELNIGVAHDLMDDEMRLELDVKHTWWSSLKALEVLNNGVATQSLPTSLKDTTEVALGMTWFWRHNTQLRLGYAYLEGANNLDAYQPAISDLTGHRLSAGFGGMMSGMHLDVAVSGVIYPDATATGTHAATYSDSFLTWMFTLTKKF